MRKATKSTAAWLGVMAGFAGLEHGYFEIVQGNTRPAGLSFPSMGPPCLPVETWNACEPAMSVVPNLLITGVLAILLSLAMIVWSAFFIQRKQGGFGLILLCLALLLFGGGFFPPLIGTIGGIIGTKINRPLPDKSETHVERLAARLWPWLLAILIGWLLGQFVVGYFFNDWLKSVMGYISLLIIVLPPILGYSAYAYDLIHQPQEQD